ncbi:MAG: chorismate lyase [Proteobacteria bacterium]|nr:chorismate lyase [Pseudomonadota bacterium]
MKNFLSEALSPVARLLLTSDGSMTRMLEALTLSTVSMIMKRQEILTAKNSLLNLKAFDCAGKALAREVWLSCNGKPLIYAHSLLLAADDGRYSLESIRDTEKPLGRMLIDDGVKTFRGELALGLVKSPDVAADLSLPSDTDFWGRYYKLSSDSGLSGIIFELFSPHLFQI